MFGRGAEKFDGWFQNSTTANRARTCHQPHRSLTTPCGAVYPIVKALEQQAGAFLRMVFRNLQLRTIHVHAEKATEAAEAAGAQGRFWEMHDLVFEHQARLGLADLDRYAGKAGLDLSLFSADLAADRWAPLVRGQFRRGIMSGVNGTPTFFINGARYDGEYGLEELLTAVKAVA